jgi:hypothetical protein
MITHTKGRESAPAVRRPGSAVHQCHLPADSYHNSFVNLKLVKKSVRTATGRGRFDAEYNIAIRTATFPGLRVQWRRARRLDRARTGNLRRYPHHDRCCRCVPIATNILIFGALLPQTMVATLTAQFALICVCTPLGMVAAAATGLACALSLAPDCSPRLLGLLVAVVPLTKGIEAWVCIAGGQLCGAESGPHRVENRDGFAQMARGLLACEESAIR